MNFRSNQKGMTNFAQRFQDARQSGEVGVHLHMHTPQPETSRMGYAGRKVKAKTLDFVIENMLKSVKSHPEQRAALINLLSIKNGK